MIDAFNIIDGQHVVSDRTFAVTNPAKGDTVGHAPDASAQQLDLAVAAAKGAFPVRAARPDAERAAACLERALVLEAHSDGPI